MGSDLPRERNTEPGTPLLVRARNVITMSENDCGAFVMVGDRVVATGSIDVLADRFPGVDVVDLGSATVVPGFNDAHQHLSMVATQLLNVDLSADVVTDRQQALGLLRGRAEQTPRGQWVQASRYDHTRTTGGVPLTRADLDAVAPDHPVVVVHVGAHWGVVNSMGLRLAGLDESTPEPTGGSFGRDGAGRLNGLVYEQALFDLAYPSLATTPPVVPAASLADRIRGVRQACEMFLAAGITSVGDAMVGPEELRLLQSARRSGDLGVRVNALITHPHVEALAAAGVMDGFGDDWLRIGGVKAFVDGAVAGRTCAVAAPFEGTHDHGMLVVSPSELQSLVARVDAAGLRLAVHANGDTAIAMLLDALEALPGRGKPSVRHRIEHCSIVDDGLVERIRRLDLVVVPFGSYVHAHGRKILDWYGAERAERMFAVRSLLDAGVTVAGSSDYPCGPYEPLTALQSCVTRRSADGQPVGLSQRISAREALGLYTRGSATASGEGDHKGQIRPGFLADFTVLSDDPTTVPEDELAGLKVTSTWVAGRQVWSSSSTTSEDACSPARA